MISAARKPTLLLLLIYISAGKLRLLLSYNAVLFGIPTLDCTVGPMPMLIYIPHLDMYILALHLHHCWTYEGWNFNFGNAALTFDTAHLQSSYFHRPSMYSPKLCRTRSQR